MRGSVTAEDWLHNLNAVMVAAPGLGWVHAGFYAGLEDSWHLAKAIIADDPVVFAGHSRGAAQATILSAMAVRDGIKAQGRYVFGEPRSGGTQLAKLVKTIPGKSYRNGNANQSEYDPIPDVPIDIPVLEPYVHATSLTFVSRVPAPDDPWPGALAYHHMQLYQEAIAQ